MKDAYFFPHDSNALSDPKIAALISKYGFQGYGWFWAIVEKLREQTGYKYPVNKYTFDTFARLLLCERNAVVEFLNDCCHEFADCNSALLCMDEQNLWSESLIKRMKPYDEKREKARESVSKRWEKEKYERNTNVVETYNDGNTSKVNKSKVNKSKVNNNICTPDEEECPIPFKEIIDYLNEKLGTSYKHTSDKTQELIRARWNEKFTLDDFKKVIDNKITDWNHEPQQGEKDMRDYLRPITLFGTKFESYLNEQKKRGDSVGGTQNNAGKTKTYDKTLWLAK